MSYEAFTNILEYNKLCSNLDILTKLVNDRKLELQDVGNQINISKNRLAQVRLEINNSYGLPHWENIEQFEDWIDFEYNTLRYDEQVILKCIVELYSPIYLATWASKIGGLWCFDIEELMLLFNIASAMNNSVQADYIYRNAINSCVTPADYLLVNSLASGQRI